jgi:proteasome accessory factor A
MGMIKSLGRDCELSTTGIDPAGRSIDAFEVTKKVLGKIDAAFAPYGTSTWSQRKTAAAPLAPTGATSYAYGGNQGYWDSTDCLRHWGPSGQCYYSDMSHVEVCTAETPVPRHYAAQCVSLLLVAERARRAAELDADPGTCLSLSTGNVDVVNPGISWGTHLNVTVGEALWEELLRSPRRPATLAFVASAMAAAIPFFGGGYLLPLKNGSMVYSLSGRAHHISRVICTTTTTPFQRGLLNSRREPHGKEIDRLHLIGFDFVLVSAALQACFLQCCLAAAERGFCGPIAYDPVRALRTWSWSLDVRDGRPTGAAVLADGTSRTLPLYLRELAEQLLELRRRGVISEEEVPDALDLLPRIIELTHLVEAGSLVQAARHLDWAAKLLVLIDLSEREGCDFSHPEARLADHDFANTEPDRGAFWKLWESGRVDPLIEIGEAEACLADGPEESRAWGRGRLLRRFQSDVDAVDWGYIELIRTNDPWSRRLRVEMPRTDSLNRSALGPVLDQADCLSSLESLLEEQRRGTTRESDPIMTIESRIAGDDGGPELAGAAHES